MNPRQRRGTLLVALAALGAVGVFSLVSGYVADVRSEVRPLTNVLRLARAVEAHEPISDADIEQVALPQRWRPPNSLLNPADLIGVVTATDLPAKTVLQRGMLVPQPELREGERELAILVDAETGVAGRVQAQSVVDVYATFESSERQCAGLLIAGVRVVAVGLPKTRQRPGSGGQLSEQEQVLPVTFALTPKNARKLVFAESFAKEVRLALARPGERSDRATSCARPRGVGAQEDDA